MLNSRNRFLVVGCGIAGTTLAREIVEKLDCRVDIIDERDHIAGNCHTKRDEDTGVMVHSYGPHIFNTDRLDVWEYVNRHTPFERFTMRIKATTRGEVFGLPINLHTINQFFRRTFTPNEARAYISSLSEKMDGEPQTFEEQALSTIGRDLYEAFFYGYTKKQWGCEPKELPASILKRLPLRFNYDDNYYYTRYQGIPRDGYSAMVASFIDHPSISVETSLPYTDEMAKDYDHVFYTGPIDRYFGFSLGRLAYRTVTFKQTSQPGDAIGTALMNFTSADVPHTRICEHKHFAPWESHDNTVVVHEYSCETGPDDIPYYPKRLANDKSMLTDYVALANQTTGISFLGRLATYRYINMDAAIGESLDFAPRVVSAVTNSEPIPKFSVNPV